MIAQSVHDGWKRNLLLMFELMLFDLCETNGVAVSLMKSHILHVLLIVFVFDLLKDGFRPQSGSLIEYVFVLGLLHVEGILSVLP